MPLKINAGLRNRRNFARALPPGLETLEQRLLLSADWWRTGWTIKGDAYPRQPDDIIVIDRDPRDAGTLRAIVNGQVVDTRDASDTSVIRVFGGLGDDRIKIDLGKDGGGIRVFVWGGKGADLVLGGVEQDRIRGGDGHDTIKAGGGDDDIAGGAAADLLDGQGGDDYVFGAAGADILQGSSGANQLIGGDGQDWLYGRQGADNFQLLGRDKLLSGAGNLESGSTPDRVKQWLIDSAVEQWDDLFGTTVPRWRRYPMFTDFGEGGGILKRCFADATPQAQASKRPEQIVERPFG